MRVSASSLLAFLAITALLASNGVATAKKPSRPSASSRPSRPSGSGRSKPSTSSNSRAPPVSRRRQYEEEEEEEEEDDFFDDDFEEEEDEYEEEPPPRSTKKRPTGGKPSSRPPPSGRAAQSANSRRRPASYDDDEDDYEPRRRPSSSRGAGGGRRGPPPRRGGRRGDVVPYSNNQQGGTFTRGLAALRESLPDPSSLKDAAVNSFSAARDTTSRLSSNVYRDIKGLTSSELEQVMLKATRPDDTPVKGKHVERLVGVTYQISSRYDIYDAVLRKLWSKMAEKDWRTTIKALYILHRFSSDGAPEHQAALKARLRELRRTRDPKRKDKYFNSKQLLAGETTPENMKFRAFMSRYAHYVLLRAQCFGGVFDEISTEPKASKKNPKPITATALRTEHLEAAQMVLKAGSACMLKDGEDCENTAIAVERVAGDLMGLSAAVAVALNRVLKTDDWNGADVALIKKWCEFYGDELLPQTRSMVKKTSPKLDAYGLFLPSRMGTTVSQELLQKGLKAVADDEAAEDCEVEDEAEEAEADVEEQQKEDEEEEDEDEEDEEIEEPEDEDEDDEWDYEEEYYDDEEE
eukprot:CAMPEP_0119004758 /NCGR_PEP_ID=MMETSP1176-20130426/1333_1 /TAXON_ID=265551 /ORGANISM="Synedropsis recta cf, Strain CCMP1620" /LENGTH=577 /DNA_ID=CAMNT_0006956503 /DNA_START=50 /DNA_END=1783 /DNA_ORIENTATION=+